MWKEGTNVEGTNVEATKTSGAKGHSVIKSPWEF